MEHSWTLSPVYDSIWLAMGLCGLVAFMLWWVTPPTPVPSRRRMLLALRLIAVVVLVLSLLRPTQTSVDSRPAQATLVVAIDRSESMTLPDGGGTTRLKTQSDAYRDLVDRLLKWNDDRLRIRTVAYADDATAIDTRNAVPDSAPLDLSTVEANGVSTDLSNAVKAALEPTDVGLPMGVVLLGDGRQTASPPQGGVRQIANELNGLGIPLWSVPIGPVATTASRDVALSALPESYRVFAGNRFNVDFKLGWTAPVDSQIKVRLVFESEDGSQIDAAARLIDPNSQTNPPGQGRLLNGTRPSNESSGNDRNMDQVRALSVSVDAPKPGTYQLRVVAEAVPGETLVTNNEQVAFVDVRDGGGRIVYLEGVRRFEQVFIRRSIRRYADLEVNPITITSDTRSQWPYDLDELLDGNRFDVFILGDLPAEAIGNRQWEKLAKQVRDGAGLITLGGTNAYAGGGYQRSPLNSLIPVELSGTDQSVDRDVRLGVTEPHPITNLGDATAWNDLASMPGANRFQKTVVASGVRTLLEDADSAAPMLVIGTAGKGRVASLAFDSTYRWWRRGNDDAHRRFWRQLILWAMSREVDSDQTLQIRLDRRRIDDEKPTSFLARQDGPSGQAAWKVEIFDGKGQPVGKKIPYQQRIDQGEIEGTIPKLPPGIYRLRVQRPLNGSGGPSSNLKNSGAPAVAEVAFQVVARSPEWEQPAADLESMRQLAAMTSRQGGSSYSASKMSTLVEAIRERRSESTSPIRRRRRIGDGVLDAWFMYVAFAISLGSEWYLRRRWNLA